MCLLGTFLVRSGVLTSVHAFANDPARGVFDPFDSCCSLPAAALALYAWRAPKLVQGGLFALVSREGALILNNVMLCPLAAAVLLGDALSAVPRSL